MRLERTYADAASSTNSAILPLDVPIWPQVPATVELVPALNGAFQRLWMYRWQSKGRLSLEQLAEVLEDRLEKSREVRSMSHYIDTALLAPTHIEWMLLLGQASRNGLLARMTRQKRVLHSQKPSRRSRRMTAYQTCASDAHIRYCVFITDCSVTATRGSSLANTRHYDL